MPSSWRHDDAGPYGNLSRLRVRGVGSCLLSATIYGHTPWSILAYRGTTLHWHDLGQDAPIATHKLPSDAAAKKSPGELAVEKAALTLSATIGSRVGPLA